MQGVGERKGKGREKREVKERKGRGEVANAHKPRSKIIYYILKHCQDAENIFWHVLNSSAPINDIKGGFFLVRFTRTAIKPASSGTRRFLRRSRSKAAVSSRATLDALFRAPQKHHQKNNFNIASKFNQSGYILATGEHLLTGPFFKAHVIKSHSPLIHTAD